MNAADSSTLGVWYVVQTKPRQEAVARDNLSRQGFSCMLPLLKAERIRGGKRVWAEEPLFARYLFMTPSTAQAQWGAVRSTRGVSRLVEFGGVPARLPAHWVEALGSCEHAPRRLFAPGEHVVVKRGPFAGIEGLYEMSDGDERAVVMLELLGKQCRARFALEMLRAA
jgi:transcriptional antiterminator RfaH